MVEKRKFIRLKIQLKVIYKVIKKHKRQKTHSSVIYDISGGGFKIKAKEHLRMGDLLDAEIEIPHLAEPVHAVAEVVWFTSGSNPAAEGHDAGLRFRDIDPRDLHRVLEYVHSIAIG